MTETDLPDDDTKIVRPAYGDESLRSCERPGKCRHSPIKLDYKEGVVYCGNCGDKLDAFHVLKLYCEGERRYWYAKDNLKQVHHDLADAERRLKNLKANIKRNRLVAEMEGLNPHEAEMDTSAGSEAG